MAIFLFLREQQVAVPTMKKMLFLVNVGGGHADVPHFHDFWWNETVIRIETVGGGKGNYETGVEIFWFVKQIPIPEKIWGHKDEIVKMISEH